MTMFERPCTRDSLAARPWIDGVFLSQGMEYPPEHLGRGERRPHPNDADLRS